MLQLLQESLILTISELLIIADVHKLFCEFHLFEECIISARYLYSLLFLYQSCLFNPTLPCCNCFFIIYTQGEHLINVVSMLQDVTVSKNFSNITSTWIEHVLLYR